MVMPGHTTHVMKFTIFVLFTKYYVHVNLFSQANLSFTQVTNKKLLEIKKILEPDITDEMPIDTNARPAELDRRDHQRTGMKDGSTNGCFHSIGPDLTRTRELPEQQQNVCMRSRQGVSARDKDSSRTPISMREVNEPILQQVKLQKAIAQ